MQAAESKKISSVSANGKSASIDRDWQLHGSVEDLCQGLKRKLGLPVQCHLLLARQTQIGLSLPLPQLLSTQRQALAGRAQFLADC